MKKTLIANSGIQFIEIPITIDDDSNLKTEKSFAENIEYDAEGKEVSGNMLFPYKWEERYIDFDSINAEAIDRNGDVMPENIKEDFVTTIDHKEIYKVRGRDALDIFSSTWLPIPYFRTRNDPAKPYHEGPRNWCRMYVDVLDSKEATAQGATHKVVLAFDTQTSANSDGNYNLLDAKDTTTGTNGFKCVTKERYFQSFYTSDSIDNWLSSIYDERVSKIPKQHFKHFATYFVLLEIMEAAGGFPEIVMLEKKKHIDTTLVLDLGNSRTCGLITQTTAQDGPIDLTMAQKLKVRDLSNPLKTYSEPFEMQVVFAQERFGNNATDLMDGVFNWPSLVRVGREAVKLTSIFEREESSTTMGSPKRYLWDTEPARRPWCKVPVNNNENVAGDDAQHVALYGMAQYLDDTGKVTQNTIGAMNSNYSRASIMMFSLVEIIMHALSQINSAAFRTNQGDSNLKRLLKSIVVTCPTAMPIAERTAYHNALKDAIDIVRKDLDTVIHTDFRIIPEKNLQEIEEENKAWYYDEATCSQFTYLYNELTAKYAGRHEHFFEAKGKKDLENDQHNLTLASVDIGGGTTDVMICKFTYDKLSKIPVLRPKPIFWEGFNIAGDDIVKRIIEFMVVPSLINSIKAMGGVDVEDTISYLMGPNKGNQTAAHRIYRKQIANQIATYCAYDIIDQLNNNDEIEERTLAQILTRYGKPKNNLVPYFNQIVRERSKVADFSLYNEQVKMNYDNALFHHAVSDVIAPSIKSINKLLGIFKVDMLLLSGRSSKLKPVYSQFENTLVLEPSKIVNFSSYKMGNWYPFKHKSGFSDPKTMVSVGALIAYLSSINKLQGFQVQLDQLSQIDSTMNVLGVLNVKDHVIASDQVVMASGAQEGSFEFYGDGLNIGAKQLQVDEWIAKPLYSFNYKDDRSKEAFSISDYKLPLTVTLVREDDNKEEIILNQCTIEDREGNDMQLDEFFKLCLRTQPVGSLYWTETGAFLIKNR